MNSNLLPVQTSRLIFRQFEERDSEDIFNLNSDYDVLKYTGDKPFNSLQDAKRFILEYDDYKRCGMGRWAVISILDQSFIGWCGLKKHNEGFVDLGFRFFKSKWGNGFATEAAIACLDYGFNNLNLMEIVGRAASENIASLKVLEKVGFTFSRIEECHGIENARIYTISKKTFKKV